MLLSGRPSQLEQPRHVAWRRRGEGGRREDTKNDPDNMANVVVTAHWPDVMSWAVPGIAPASIGQKTGQSDIATFTDEKSDTNTVRFSRRGDLHYVNIWHMLADGGKEQVTEVAIESGVT